MDTGAYANPWKGLAGGNPLPEDYASTVWPDWGFIAPTTWTPGSLVGYDGFSYIDDSRPQPDKNDWTTWRDRWMETAIKEALQPIV